MFLFVMGFGWIADAMEVLLLSFLGPALRCEWDITPGQESSLTMAVFFGMSMYVATGAHLRLSFVFIAYTVYSLFMMSVQRCVGVGKGL